MSWEDYKKITIIIPRNSVEETLIDFPLMLNLSNESGLAKTDLSEIFTELPSAAYRFKIAVLDDQNNQLYVEISSWRPQFKKAILWVKIPIIDPLYETTLYLYYGAGMPPNTEYVGDVGSTAGQNVWPAFYDIVLHTNQRTYNNGVITESTTTSGNHICTGGGFYTSNLTSGYLDNAIRFNGLDNVLKSPYYWDEVPFNNFVIEVFCKAESTHEIDTQSSTNTAGVTGQRYLLAPMTSNSTESVCLGVSLGTNGVTVYEHGTSHLAPVAVYAQTLGTDFHYICIRYNDKIPYIYVDGDLVYTGPSSVKTNVYRPTDIGGMDYGYFCGILYEARFTNSLISEAWINLNSKTLFDQVVIYKTNNSAVGWLKTYENGVLSPWENRIKIEIDHTKIDETLIDFPVLLNISEGSGVNNKNLNFLLTENILNKIALTADDGTTLLYAEKEVLPGNLYTPNSPPGNNSIYVKASSQYGGYPPYFATNRALLLIGSESSTSWLSDRYTTKEQKFNIDYGRSFIAKRIYLENNHSNGGYTSWGIKDATLYGTDDYDAFLNTIYSNIDNLTELLNFTARPHILLNASDAQYFYLDNNFLSFRYYVLRLHSNSGSNDYIGIRHIEIQEKLEINTLTIWTKIPLVKPNEITTLYLYYDANKSNNTEYIGEIGTEISKKVWSNNYVSVHHLSQINSSTSNFKDSVATYNSINTSPGNTPYTIDGRIGMNFDGANSYIDIGKNMNIVGPYTYEVLANPRTLGEGGYGRFFDNNQFYFYAYSDVNRTNALEFQMNASTDGDFVGNSGDIVFNTTQYFSVTWEVINATTMAYRNVHFFKNDTLVPTTLITAPAGSSDVCTNTIIGNRAAFDRGFDGIIFEVRISNTIRTEGWLKASYHSIMDELLSYNEVETYVETPTQYYAYEGYVKNKATPVERKVLLYERTTGLLMDVTTSDNQGHYLLQTPYNTEHFIVVLDNIADYKFNPLIQDRILPNGS